MTTNSNDVIVSLDVGSSKVLCVVARPGDDKGFHRVLGIGNVRSQGIRQGTVIDVDDIGTIHILWDSGSTLGVVYGEDSSRKIGGNTTDD